MCNEAGCNRKIWLHNQSMKKPTQNWKLYIIECKDGSLYTGVTTDLTRRIETHESGKGAKYTRGRGPFKLVYSKNFRSKGKALKREFEIKLLSKGEKLKLCAIEV